MPRLVPEQDEADVRLGLVGSAGDDLDTLRRAVDLLFGELGVDMMIYLGADGAIDRLAREWGVSPSGGDTRSFEESAFELAIAGTSDEIRRLLSNEANLRKLDAIRVLPPAPARAIEMLDDRFVLFVHDKSLLDEDDIANSQVIVYGLSKQMLFRRFGPRAFFTPGPLAEGHLGILETDADGRITITAADLRGAIVLRESLAGRSSRMSVAQ